MKYYYRLTLHLLILFLLSGCLYNSPLSSPSSQIDTWLLGQWITQDKSGKIFEAVITPVDNTHYHVTFSDKDKNDTPPWEFEGWISRVGNLKFLTLQSLSRNPRFHNKYLFLHYELVKSETDKEKDVIARKIRISEPQLPASDLYLDSYHLRQEITKKVNQGTLLLPDKAPLGFSIWTRTGGEITWPKQRIF
jgi:hypothetical protein